MVRSDAVMEQNMIRSCARGGHCTTRKHSYGGVACLRRTGRVEVLAYKRAVLCAMTEASCLTDLVLERPKRPERSDRRLVDYRLYEELSERSLAP
jgi:hypothetical protein